MKPGAGSDEAAIDQQTARKSLRRFSVPLLLTGQADRAELDAVRQSIDRGTGVLIPSDPHREQITAAETMFSQAERMITADPIGAQEVIALAPDADGLESRPRSGQAPKYLFYSLLDDLALPWTISGMPRPNSD